jgi:hypothetical protein
MKPLLATNLLTYPSLITTSSLLLLLPHCSCAQRLLYLKFQNPRLDVDIVYLLLPSTPSSAGACSCSLQGFAHCVDIITADCSSLLLNRLLLDALTLFSPSLIIIGLPQIPLLLTCNKITPINLSKEMLVGACT